MWDMVFVNIDDVFYVYINRRNMDVVLEPSEMLTASQVGLMRHIQNLKLGRIRERSDQRYNDKPHWQVQIEGALGEYALSKALGLFWSGGVGDCRALDIGGCLEVRTTAKIPAVMYITLRDKDDGVYILLNGKNGNYRVKGWIYGGEGKDDRFRHPMGSRDGGELYVVPEKALRSIDTLKGVLYEMVA